MNYCYFGTKIKGREGVWPRLRWSGSVLLVVAGLLAAQGCGGGGGSEQAADKPAPKPGPATQPEPDPAPEPTGDPRLAAVLDVYNKAVRAAKDEPQHFGKNFIEVQPPASTGYAEGYFWMERFEGESMELIQRPLIRASAVHGTPLGNLYESLYCSAATGKGKAWDLAGLRRVTGFVFAGYAATPEAVMQRQGVYCNLFLPAKNDPGKRRFQVLDNPEFLWLGFNLRDYLFSGIEGGFVSFTRSVNVVRHFALNPGQYGKPAETGYVYVAYVSGALDGSDPGLHSMHAYEQEVAAPGLVPASHIVAWRKILKNPGSHDHPAPPEFVGPIHVRERLQALEPEACGRIMQALTTKSLFTKRHEEGVAWRHFLNKTKDPAYRAQVLQEHPNPTGAAIWGD